MRAVRKRDRDDPKTAPKATMRCAVYTRKSSDEGLDQEFNSLDAQRDAAEAFIMSQRAEGWACLPAERTPLAGQGARAPLHCGGMPI